MKPTPFDSPRATLAERNDNCSIRGAAARKTQILTSDVVAENSRRDDLAVRAEERLQVLLCHAFRESGNVQIGALYGV